MEKTLHEQKVEIKKVWEDCFKIKMEDKLTEEGIKKFWSDDFTIKECFDLLTEAGIDHVAGKIIDDVLGDLGDLDVLKGAKGIAVISIDSDDDNDEQTFKCKCECSKPEGKKEEQYHVLRDGKVMGSIFYSEEDANEFIKHEACTSEFTVDDFKLVKVL